jgi:hypothetical protein
VLEDKQETDILGLHCMDRLIYKLSTSKDEKEVCPAVALDLDVAVLNVKEMRQVLSDLSWQHRRSGATYRRNHGIS